MNDPHKVYFVDHAGKNRYDVLGSKELAIQYAKTYVCAGYTNVTIFDVYNNVEIKF